MTPEREQELRHLTEGSSGHVYEHKRALKEALDALAAAKAEGAREALLEAVMVGCPECRRGNHPVFQSALRSYVHDPGSPVAVTCHMGWLLARAANVPEPPR